MFALKKWFFLVESSEPVLSRLAINTFFAEKILFFVIIIMQAFCIIKFIILSNPDDAGIFIVKHIVSEMAETHVPHPWPGSMFYDYLEKYINK